MSSGGSDDVHHSYSESLESKHTNQEMIVHGGAQPQVLNYEDHQELIMREVTQQLQENPDMSPAQLMRHLTAKFDII